MVLVEIKQYFQAQKTPNQRKILNTIAESFKIDKDSKQYQQKLELLSDLIKDDMNAETNFSVEAGDYLIHYLQLNLDEALQLRKKSLDIEKIGLRDKFMAANMLWFCRYSKSSGKGIFAAHNGHVAKFDSPVYESSGRYLQKSLVDKYFSIYVGFAHGTTEAVDVQSGHLNNCIISGSSDAFSYNLNFDHRKSFFMNLRTAGNQVKSGLNQSLLFNGIWGCV